MPQRPLLQRFLRAIDWIAMLTAILGVCVLIGGSAIIGALGALRALFEGLRAMWINHHDRPLIVASVVSLAWCAARWKKINSTP